MRLDSAALDKGIHDPLQRGHVAGIHLKRLVPHGQILAQVFQIEAHRFVKEIAKLNKPLDVGLIGAIGLVVIFLGGLVSFGCSLLAGSGPLLVSVFPQNLGVLLAKLW